MFEKVMQNLCERPLGLKFGQPEIHYTLFTN